MATTPPPAAPAPAPAAAAPYPVQLDIEYPEGPRNRLTVFFRLILAVPVFILIGILTNPTSTDDNWALALTGAGFIFLPTLLLLLFRHRYPRWWFEFNVNLYAFVTRASMYATLLRDEYPSTEDRQALDLRIPYPDAKAELSRWLPLVKWLLAIPHYVILSALFLALLVVTIIAWFAILFTGRYPRGLFDFAVGVNRWSTRVYAYSVLLTTDRYPPFRLAA